MYKRLIPGLFVIVATLPATAHAAVHTPDNGKNAPPPPEDAGQAAVMAKNCAAARHNLETLTTAVRRRIVGPDGVAYYMSEEERQARIDEAKAVIAEQCK